MCPKAIASLLYTISVYERFHGHPLCWIAGEARACLNKMLIVVVSKSIKRSISSVDHDPLVPIKFKKKKSCVLWYLELLNTGLELCS